MKTTPSYADILAHMLTWGQMCSATVELLETAIRAETTEQTGRILVAQAGVKAVWSEMLELMEKLDSCAEVRS